MALKDGGPCVVITAPACSYGDAAYLAIARCPQRTRNYKTHRAISRPVASGQSVLITMPEVWSEAEVLLHLTSLEVYAGAFVDATPEELADALKHPFQSVREQTVLDIAEKASFRVADAVVKAYRRERREKRERGD